MRRVVIVGSTGSIGLQALEVADAFREHLRVVGLVAGGGREDLFASQVRRLRPEVAALMSPDAASRVAAATGREILAGPEGVKAAAGWPSADMVLNAVVGFGGLEPTLVALEAGKRVALANKESLVAGGSLVTRAAQKGASEVLPVDSEPSAIHRLLDGRDPGEVETLILTASGGPFAGRRPEDLEMVTPAEALAHPTWRMGPKITVDSATLMNKGLEVIEASWFFGLPVDRIKVLVHRQSVVHSMVELKCGTVLAHLGPADMRYPIQDALLYPLRASGPWPRLDLTTTPALTFSSPDVAAFPCLKLAYQAGRIGGSLPAVLSAANEVLVDEFLTGRIGFGDIPRLLEGIVSSHAPFETETLSDVARADSAGREEARSAARSSRQTSS